MSDEGPKLPHRIRKGEEINEKKFAENAEVPKDYYEGEDRYGKFEYSVDSHGLIWEGTVIVVGGASSNSPRWERFTNDHPDEARRLLDISAKRSK